MHHCLTVPEILHLLYEELNEKHSFHLALSCKTFLEPGLDKIWLNVKGFEPLIACLPEGLLKSSASGLNFDPDYIYTLTRDLQDKDLSRYLIYYAPRIRHFALGRSRHGERSVLSSDTLKAFQQVTHDAFGALSPNLASFQWFNPEITSFGCPVQRLRLSSYMSLFLGNKVTSVRIEVGDHEVENHDVDTRLHHLAVCKALERLGPQLESLDISGFHLLDYPRSGFRWGQLRELYAFGWVFGDVPHLAALPCLVTLDISKLLDHTNDWDASLENLPVSNGFPLLETLSGSSDHFSDVDHILRHLSPNNRLKAFVWRQYLPPTTLDFEVFTDVLLRRCTLPSLVRLKLTNLTTPDADPAGAPRIDITPLFSLKHIEDVDLDLQFDLGLTPDTLRNTLGAWSHLRSLRLCTNLILDLIPQISLTHVVEIVREFPLLEELGLQFDGTIIGDDRSSPRPSTLVPGLRALCVGHSSIESPHQVAVLLKTWLPALRVLELGYYLNDNEDHLDARRWGAVRKELGFKAGHW